MTALQSLQTKITQRPPTSYRGRFAPSPSGFLHFGSLIAALASFLQAKSKQGAWLVRIEDIDKPRELIGADKKILNTLEAYGLHWDEKVLYQSQQTQLYAELLADLQQQKRSYNCHCTRAQIKQSGGVYLGTCKYLKLPEKGAAIRLINQFPYTEFDDVLQGKVKVNCDLAKEDFIIHRRDGLFAYQLAVVADDIYQGITEVVRGCDLLEPTARQLTLFQTFKAQPPSYLHVPLAVTEQGYKLSKQNSAPAIDNNYPQPALIQALKFLGQNPPKELIDYSVDEIILWAIDNWQVNGIPKMKEIML